jgi:hypothetical protein
MVYLTNQLCWGKVIVKDQIRISTWLRTNAAPEYVTLHQANLLLVQSGKNLKPQSGLTLHIPVSLIGAMHLIPPEKDPIDYDPNEPNRRMEPISIFVGSFQFKGNVRLSSSTTVSRYLEVTHETFSALYDVEITNPLLEFFGVVKTPFVLVRQNLSIYTS